MLQKIITLFFFTAITITILQSCDSTEPIDDNKPGRRDYVWAVDTLNTPDNTYSRMWGISPTNIWLISPGGWDKSIAHFDGFDGLIMVLME